MGGLQGRFRSICRDMPSKSTIFGDPENNNTEYRRILITTDMSTECDDECALLWILAALNKRRLLTTIELLMSDSQVRYQWMAYLFNEKMKVGGEWEVKKEGGCMQVGCV